MHKVCVLLLALLLTSCSANYDNSGSPNWFKTGERSAVSGELLVSAVNLAKEMKLDAVTASDYEEYLQGYQQGLDKFCDVNNAFLMGAKGHRYHGQCEGRRNEPQFKYEWARGLAQVIYPK
ncbi:DUF2799 domain-containing protein [Psychromonas aquimarina]|uniref:DUF2799 domain-containing protein n=1 Tax=Psychromonas aquimarina TaxID=444919 RepID=UPI0004222B5C|nr:DUF2799 domain-containing protein [Psychromonas aquimarina]